MRPMACTLTALLSEIVPFRFVDFDTFRHQMCLGVLERVAIRLDGMDVARHFATILLCN